MFRAAPGVGPGGRGSCFWVSGRWFPLRPSPIFSQKPGLCHFFRLGKSQTKTFLPDWKTRWGETDRPTEGIERFSSYFRWWGVVFPLEFKSHFNIWKLHILFDLLFVFSHIHIERENYTYIYIFMYSCLPDHSWRAGDRCWKGHPLCVDMSFVAQIECHACLLVMYGSGSKDSLVFNRGCPHD